MLGLFSRVFCHWSHLLDKTSNMEGLSHLHCAKHSWQLPLVLTQVPTAELCPPNLMKLPAFPFRSKLTVTTLSRCLLCLRSLSNLRRLHSHKGQERETDILNGARQPCQSSLHDITSCRQDVCTLPHHVKM